MVTLLGAIVGAVFGIERLTRFINRRIERRNHNDELWERIVRRDER